MIRSTKAASNKNGFTLIEMLIAVAVLSLLGLVVIQVFITASSLNHKAADMDRAVAVSTAVVERLKGLPANTELDSQTIGGLFPEAVAGITVDGLDGSMSMLYGSDWELMSMASSQSPAFILEARLKPGSSKLGNVTLLTVKVVKQTRYFHKADPQPLLFELEAALPQPMKGGVH